MNQISKLKNQYKQLKSEYKILEESINKDEEVIKYRVLLNKAIYYILQEQ